MLAPFFLVRFGLLSALSPTAVRRAAHFAPLSESEKPAYWLYQLSTAAIVVSLLFLKIKLTPTWLFCAGLAVYLVGLLLLIVSVVNFAAPAENGFNQNGLYRFSRNPMYAAYFLFFLGCALTTRSPLLLGLVLLFQITAHWIILAEERWCAGKFGPAYLRYKEKVRRYL